MNVMKIYILAQNEQGYFLAKIKDDYYLIDDYSGNVEINDVLQIEGTFKKIGKHICYNPRREKLWISIAGDIAIPNEYFPDCTE